MGAGPEIPGGNIEKAPRVKVFYSVLPRKDSSVCDVQATEEHGETRVVNTFNSEADAWQWITEQEQAGEICARLERNNERSNQGKG
jgi:hypothetical protein